MRSKLNFLINTSIKKKVKSKWFLISNLVIAVILIGIINIDSIVTFFGGDFDSKTKIYVVDDTKVLFDSFKENLKYYETTFYGEDNEAYDVVKADESYDELKDKILNTEKSSYMIYLYFDGNDDLKTKFVSLSSIDSYDYQLISGAIKSSCDMYNLSKLDLSSDELAKITEGVSIEREILDESITNEEENVEMIMKSVFPIIILPFFMLTIFLVQMIGSEVNDEKSTKSMEIIISNVSPKTHFMAKVIANNLFIFFQAILLILYSYVGILLRKYIGGNSIVNGITNEIVGAINTLKDSIFADKFVIVLVFSIILLVLTLIGYSLVSGILASMTTNSEDYQQVQIPIVVVLLLGYYLSIMAGLFKGSTFIKVLSFIPFISSVLSPSLLVMGQIGLFEIIVSNILMLITVFILIKYGLRIYKVGILNYSSSNMWGKIFKSLKNK